MSTGFDKNRHNADEGPGSGSNQETPDAFDQMSFTPDTAEEGSLSDLTPPSMRVQAFDMPDNLVDQEWDSSIHFPYTLETVAASSTERGRLAEAITQKLEQELQGEITPGSIELNRSQGNSNLSFTAESESGMLHIRVRLGNREHYDEERARVDTARSFSSKNQATIPEIKRIGELGAIEEKPFSYSLQPRVDAIPLDAIDDTELRTHIWRTVGEVVAPLHDIPEEPEVDPDIARVRLSEFLKREARDDRGTFLVENGILTESEWASLKERFTEFSWEHEVESVMCHDDLNSNNILVDRDTQEAYIIDWEKSTGVEVNFKAEAGLSLLGRYREVIWFTNPFESAQEKEEFLSGLGMAEELRETKNLRRDIDTVQAAFSLDALTYFHRLANGDISGDNTLRRMVSGLREIARDENR